MEITKVNKITIIKYINNIKAYFKIIEENSTTVGHLIWPLQIYGHMPGESMADCNFETE